ncbi:hypothetical protein ACJVC5_05260 [Peredibacter sp. HCB2-198]|uniref:hypothetical protein n=1 Tax=Peredibacter sp. HCB2-198 TaxID=3383025 RepID=UPI0038B57EE2
MSFMLNRMFAYFTLAAYLFVGTVALRFAMPVVKEVSISGDYLSLFSETSFKTQDTLEVAAPEMHFADIKFPVEKKAVVVAVKPVVKAAPVVVAQKPAELKLEKVAKNELPFYEPVKLHPVVMNQPLQTNLIALYKDLETNMVAKSASPVSDEVSTIQSSDAEPTFFEYDEEEKVAAQKPAPIPEIPTKDEVVNNVDKSQNVDSVSEEVSVDDLVAFDYSQVNADIKSQAMPMVSTVTTQKSETPAQGDKAPATTSTSKGRPAPQQEEVASSEKNALLVPKEHASRLTIQLVGTDFVTTQSEVGFELRFQDDLTEAIQDYGNGEVTIQNKLASARMNRSVTLLKRGFAPTNTDLIVEEGDAAVSVPAIEETKFNKLLAPYESRGPIGAVLVELDDAAEDVTLDVPYSAVMTLDGELNETKESDFRYQLFVGVKAGNALLSYKDGRGEVTSKIIHIHERELTFEANFFEDVKNEAVKLFEEDLLGQEKTPLIISSEQVKQFATDKTAKKLNDHTYKMDFDKTLLGARRYLELGHQDEPVFVGLKENTTVEVPSENFMRYILSRFEGAKLGNRCLVQVNLSKKAVKFDVAAESVGMSLVTYTQVLDADGKFYDSLGEKSRKIIVVGENQGAEEYSQDGKINLKVTYQDGSVDYLGSYCSPNTYLVEQL